jgi:hypothetical protein
MIERPTASSGSPRAHDASQGVAMPQVAGTSPTDMVRAQHEEM